MVILFFDISRRGTTRIQAQVRYGGRDMTTVRRFARESTFIIAVPVSELYDQ
jgi:hypothetical protein